MHGCLKLQNFRIFRLVNISRFCTSSGKNEIKNKLPIFKITKKAIKDSSNDIKELNSSTTLAEFCLSKMRFEAGKYLYNKVGNATFEDFKLSEFESDKKVSLKPKFDFIQVLGPFNDVNYLNDFFNLECAQIHIVFMEFEKGKFAIQSTFGESYIGGENTEETVSQFLSTMSIADADSIKDAARKVVEDLKTSQEVEIVLTSSEEPVKFKFIHNPFRKVIKKYISHTSDICEYVMQKEDQTILRHKNFNLIGRLTEQWAQEEDQDPQQVIVTLAAVVGNLLIGEIRNVGMEVLTVAGLEVRSKGRQCLVLEEGSRLPCKVLPHSCQKDLEIFLTLDSEEKLLLDEITLPQDVAKWSLLVDAEGKMAIAPN